jgi:hypothetical protein
VPWCRRAGLNFTNIEILKKDLKLKTGEPMNTGCSNAASVYTAMRCISERFTGFSVVA